MFRIWSQLYCFARLTRKDVELSSYNELVQKMAKLYNYKEFKSRNSVSLLQMHHLYNIFKEGDRVIDIGAGSMGWTDMAIKYTKSPSDDPLVISLDEKDLPKVAGTTVVKGDFLDKQTKIKLAEVLGDNRLDLVLIQANPRYTGVVEIDAPVMNAVVNHAIQFGEKFVKPGATFICKVMHFTDTPLVQKSLRSVFLDVAKYKPMHARKRSPVFYYVLKGFLLSQTFILNKRFKQEMQISKNKQGVLKKYRPLKTDLFDPEQYLKKQIEMFVYMSLDQSIAEDVIVSNLEKAGFGFTNPLRYVEKFKKAKSLAGKSGAERLEYMKREFGETYAFPVDVPTSIEDQMKIAEQFQKQQNEQEDEKDPDDELLDKDEQYMKNTYELPATEDYYIEEDLNEDLSRKHDIFRQSDIEKMKKEIPGFENLLQKTIENKLTDEDVQKFSNNPFSQDPEKQMKRQERRKNEELRNVLRQGRTNERQEEAREDDQRRLRKETMKGFKQEREKSIIDQKRTSKKVFEPLRDKTKAKRKITRDGDDID